MVRRPTHPDFQDLAERSYQRQIRQLKPDTAAYAKQKEQEDERQVVRTSERGLVPAAEANVPAAVATYGAHKPDDAAVDRLVSHLNNECVFLLTPDRTRFAAAPAGEKTTPTQKSRISTKRTSTLTKRLSAYVQRLTQYFDEHTKEIRENCTLCY